MYEIGSSLIKWRQQKDHLDSLKNGTASVIENSGFAAAIHKNRDLVSIDFGGDSRLNRLLKSKPFPVVDLINWSDKEKDAAVIAYLQDIGERGFAATYKMRAD